MRVGPSSLAGSVVARYYFERTFTANKQAHEASEYASPPLSDYAEGEGDDEPWPPSDLKWVCDDGTTEDMNPS